MASQQYVNALKRSAEPLSTDWYGYKLAHRPAQEAAAAGLSTELGIAFHPDDILLTRGAHGALGAALGAVVDAGDEVIFVSPPWFFYEAMILGVGATPIKTRLSRPAFDLDLDAIAAAITPRTRMLLLNTPHNPTAWSNVVEVNGRVGMNGGATPLRVTRWAPTISLRAASSRPNANGADKRHARSRLQRRAHTPNS